MGHHSKSPFSGNSDLDPTNWGKHLFGSQPGLNTLIGGAPGIMANALTKKAAPPSQPNLPSNPSLGDATMKALQDQLGNEVQMRAQRSLFAGSGGLLSATPYSASSVLLGGG